MPHSRRIVILAEGKFGPLESKTANQAIRYLPDQVLGVIDSRKAGRRVQEVLGFGGDIPIFADLKSSLPLSPDTLLIGIAPTGGMLPQAWRSIIIDAIAAKLFVSNHTIKTHINRIFAKTGSRDRAAAIGYAHRHHIG